MGVQLVVSLLMASVMQRMSPHWSFARWLLCNGSLYRYKHPSEEELCALAGKQKPKAKKERRLNGVAEDKPLSVPKDIDLHLETKPITTMDALVLRYFLEYQWFVDFALYAAAVYLLTEGYYCLADPQKEVNIGVLWCLLSVFFSIKVLFTMMRHYFRSEEGGERSVCLAFALFFLLVAMMALIVREEYLEFGLQSGFANLHENLEAFLKQQGYDWLIPISKLTIKLSLVAFCSFIGACLTFPGLRLAQTHLDALKMAADRPMLQILLHASFLPPVIVVLLWIKPISRDFMLQAPLGKQSVQLMSDDVYDSVRLWTITLLCALRCAMMRYHLQAYLGLADRWVQQLKREAGRIPIIEIQRKISRIFCYMTVVALQYIAPIILSFHATLLLKTMGNYSWGLLPATPPTADATPAASGTPAAEGEEGDVNIQATVAQITGALRGICTPLFYRGLLAFLIWWVSLCQIITSLFGLYFHQYLVAS
ncbi:transmembrane protein 161A isoform X2 [Rhinatrema bivittatum]|nr:transmembrane protein 161A isoform X2 [Rhinatrema bivittatum]XP_029469708.1 transmembrane protein 161A isoform X2 [Rhinatrema bivittatum]XP_029469709.1 transmembrane protein 161A isoform X2 [Rhinatrema bivittatum]